MLTIIKNHIKIKISTEYLAFLIALYCSLCLNHQLLTQISNSWVNTLKLPWTTVLTILTIFTLYQTIIMNLISWGKIAKYIGAIVISCTAIADYFCKNYGISFDIHMLFNIFHADLQESVVFMTNNLWVHYIKFGLLPTICVLSITNIKKVNFVNTLFRKITITILMIVITIGLTWHQFKNITTILKVNLQSRHQLLPASFMIATVKLLEKTNFQQALHQIDPGATREKNFETRKPMTVILIIGETVRAKNWELSGNYRQTTPKLSKLAIINFPYATNCGTNTEISVPCMLSPYGRDNYNYKKIRTTESILHLLHSLNIDVTWIDNQSGCQGTCRGLKNFHASHFDPAGKFCKKGYCLDGALIHGMEQSIVSNTQDQIIVLHQLGNHGPNYFARTIPDYLYHTLLGIFEIRSETYKPNFDLSRGCSK